MTEEEPNGIFAEHAREYTAVGLRVIPTGGADGKIPQISGWQRATTGWVEWMVRKFPSANIAVIDGGEGGITRIDIDDPSLFDDAVQRFGETPLIIGTPSGGMHLWYRWSGERRNIHIEGMAIDVLASGGYGLVPPSARPGGQQYEFLSGDLRDFGRLPSIPRDALPDGIFSASPQKPEAPAKKPSPPILVDLPKGSRRVSEGHRNKTLFDELRAIACLCENADELWSRAQGINECLCEPPLPEAEVQSIVRSVWRYRLDGRLVAPGSKTAVFPVDLILCLASKPMALVLLAYLQAHHGPDHVFKISIEGREESGGLSGKLGVSPGALRSARDFLVEREYLELIRVGRRVRDERGRWRQLPSEYRFGPGLQKMTGIELTPLSSSFPLPTEEGETVH